MDFFQCLGVLVLLLVDLEECGMTNERGSLWSGGEGREATLPGETEARSSESENKNIQ
jgi:hypothetical protein